MSARAELIDLIKASFEASALKRIVLSKCEDKERKRLTVRPCTHKGMILFAFEEQMSDGKALHRNLSYEEAIPALEDALLDYGQVNLLTAASDAEYHRSKKGSEVLLGGARLRSLLSGGSFSDALAETLERTKNYILTGNEPFLIHLGVSDKNGRVYDKKQAKFRQINRFLEHIRDIEDKLPAEGTLLIYDLCCGKSYLSFAVYHYFTVIRKRRVEMLGMDLKRDCMELCAETARALGFDGMCFKTGDIRRIPREKTPHLVLSLHACDTATDIVLHFAADVGARVILSTPCCQHDLLGRLKNDALSFVSAYPKLSGKLCEALTDALRLERLASLGYETSALELTDPDDTPKNTLLRAILPAHVDQAKKERAALRYKSALRFVLGTDAEDYPD